MRKWYTLKMNLTPSVEFSYEILSRWNLVEKSYEKKNNFIKSQTGMHVKPFGYNNIPTTFV